MDSNRPQVIEGLRSIEEHVREVIRMVEDDACGIDIVHQIRTIQISLHQARTFIVGNYLHTCIAAAFEERDPEQQAEAIDKIASVFKSS